MPDPIRSGPYSTAAACEKCVFGRGEHAEFCPAYLTDKVTLGMLQVVLDKIKDRQNRMEFLVSETPNA